METQQEKQTIEQYEEQPDVIKTHYWELPVASIDMWRPYTAVIHPELLEGPRLGHCHGLNLNKNVVGYAHGARGSTKSLTISFLLAKELRLGKAVWTNYPISFYVPEKGNFDRRCSKQFKQVHPCHWINRDGSLSYYESVHLDMDKYYTFSEQIRHGAVGITELQYFVESRTSGKEQNRLLGYQLMQIRKISNSFYYDVQNPRWVDNRFGWSADFAIKCADVAKKNYDYKSLGRHLQEGEVSRWMLRDISGLLTGDPFDETEKEIGPYQFDGWHFWEIYPTHFIVDIFEAMNGRNKEKLKENKETQMTMAIQKVLNDYLGEGDRTVYCTDFWDRVTDEMGCDFSKAAAGGVLKKMGVDKRQDSHGWKYLLNPFYEGMNPLHEGLNSNEGDTNE